MFKKLLAKIARNLKRFKLPYMIIGGQAVLVYGEPRLTRDIDVTLGVSVEALPRFLDILPKMGLKPLVDPEKFTPKTMVLPCSDAKTGIRVDFIFSFSPYEQQAMNRTKNIRMEGTAIRFASLEDVIIHKIVAGRPRDLEDARNIILKNPKYDEKYVTDWLKQFSDSLGEPFLERLEKMPG